jgi:hypothetical protein
MSGSNELVLRLLAWLADPLLICFRGSDGSHTRTAASVKTHTVDTSLEQNGGQ